MRTIALPVFLISDAALADFLEVAVETHKVTGNPDLVPAIGALRAEVTRRAQEAAAHVVNRYGPDVVRLLHGRPRLRVVDGDGQ